MNCISRTTGIEATRYDHTSLREDVLVVTKMNKKSMYHTIKGIF